MNLGGYRLLTQRSAGTDGVSYRAVGPDGTTVEVRVLGADRGPHVLKRLRLAALIEHPVALAVRELRLEDDPPHLALEWVERTRLTDTVRERLPLPALDAAAVVRDLAEAVAAAHRLGLAHGRLSPGRIFSPDFPRLKIDFTALDTETRAETELDARCRAPEAGRDDSPDPAADVYSLGALFAWLLTGRPTVDSISAAEPLGPLVREMLAANAADRPTAREVHARLAGDDSLPPAEDLGQTLQSEDFAAPPVVAALSLEERGRSRLRERLAGEPSATPGAPPERLGRFRLLELLGQGGMGTVYRAEDTADGTVVAVKVLRSDWAARPNALRRFYKEARILAEVNSPNVVNLLEVNQDGGVHYLVMELAPGRNLGDVLEERGRFDEPAALAVIADVARGLAEAHARGVVHRDVKPDNILMTETPKLCDFGLARHVVETESLHVTQPGAVLGTPLYVAPEQASGAAVDPRTDVYSLGATLFHLLAGRPPFSAPTPLALVAMHCNDAPPLLRQLDPDLSDGVCRLVERMLAKAPDARPADAAAVLREVERLLRGEPIDVTVHPRLPDCDPASVLRYDFVWELAAAPRQLWPHVSNTERLNQAVGLPGVQFTTEPRQTEEKAEGIPPRPRRYGRFRKAGMGVAWEEHPFEWIEGRRMGVLREYSEGPFKWLASVLELTPRPGGGTTLAHRVRIEPRGLLGRTVAAVEVGLRGRRALDRVYRRIDAFVTGKLGGVACADPFEEPPPLSGAQRRRLDTLLDRLGQRGVAPEIVERLGEFLAQAPAQEVARIRPLALARRLGLDAESVISACLHGAREGLLVLLWDILCPICRIAAEIKDSLRALREHGRCSACNLDFELDFANSVEMIFRAHPEVRASDLATYCVGGPAHSPHVAAQVRVAPGERLELELALSEGSYRVRGPQLPFVVNFRIASVPPDAPAPPPRWELNLTRRPAHERTPTLRAGRQVLEVTHDHDRELVVRVERTTGRDDPLTAARAATLALFRELFPGEVLAPGQLISVSTVTLLMTALDHPDDLYEELGDARAFAVLHEMFRLLHERIRREGGALVKTVGEGVVAAFGDPADAVRAALDLHASLAAEATTRELRLRVGVHRGAAMAATINEHLDYFGSTVSQAIELLRCVRGGEVVLTQPVAADPEVAAVLQSRGAKGEVIGSEAGARAATFGLRIIGRRS